MTTNAPVIPAIKRILVEPMEPKKQTEGGIILPQSLSDPEGPRQGKVIAIGEDCQKHICAGDTVIYVKMSAITFDTHGKSYAVVPDDAIVAIIK